MIDAENLLFARVAGQLSVKPMRRLEIVAEGFLDDDALPALGAIFVQQTRAMQLFDRVAELTGHRCQIKKQVLPQRFTAEPS